MSVAGEPLFSVVVPTHDRRQVLPEVVAALEDQTEAPPFEVVVVDDGSSDGTWEWLEGHRARVELRRVRQANAGPAAARNRGVAVARGRRVAFLGDDTVPAVDWLARHHQAWGRWRDGRPVAVLGYTRWHRRIRVTPFLEYINEEGFQFGYRLIRDPSELPFNLFYTSNVSLDRELLVAEPFDEGFPHAAWEDIDVAYRLQARHDLRLVYAPEAVVEHDHPTDLGRFCRRQARVGAAAVALLERHPELGPLLGVVGSRPLRRSPPWVRGPRRLVAWSLQPTGLRTSRLWERVVYDSYLGGLHRSWRRRSHETGGSTP